MHKKNKLYVSLIALLACISLISVGYASWTITSGSAEANGNITAEDVLYSNDYVDVIPSKNLEYCNYGFVDDKYNLTNVGEFTLAINFKELQKYKEKYNTSKMYVEIDFAYDNSINFDLFTNNNLPLNTDITKNGVSVSGLNISTQNNIKTYKFNFDIPTGVNVDIFYLTLKWTNNDSKALKMDKTNWFYTNLSPILKTKGLFTVNVKLNSKGGN